MLMGFKTPQGVEIPRLKIMDKNGDVQQVLTGPNVIEELNKRALAYKSFQKGYEVLDIPVDENFAELQEYSEIIEES